MILNKVYRYGIIWSLWIELGLDTYVISVTRTANLYFRSIYRFVTFVIAMILFTACIVRLL